MKQKINITVDTGLLSKIDNYASTNGMTRSGLFCISAMEYLNATEKAPIFTEALKQMTIAFAKGEFTEKDIKKLENYNVQLQGQTKL